MFAPATSNDTPSQSTRGQSLEDTHPLCVELEGTLVPRDFLSEAIIVLIKRNLLYLLQILFWLLQGRSVLRTQVLRRVELNPAALPYDSELVDWLVNERRTGRQIWLCTVGEEQLATRVASHLMLFDGAVTTDPGADPPAGTMSLLLVERFGAGGFDYCGRRWHDIVIWKKARGAIIRRGTRALRREASGHVHILKGPPSRVSGIVALFRALRPHQWAKNGLVLVPLLAAHRVTDLSNVSAALLAMVAFCLCASSVYVLNDLLDLEADRAHPRKSRRPFAAGHLSPSTGFVLAPLLLCLAFTTASLLPSSFVQALAGYYALTLAYSFALKGLVLIDTITLACLYTLRLVAGAASVAVPLSFWMLLFSVFLFLSLTLAKRFAELDALKRRNQLQTIGRGYQVSDLPILQSLGIAAGYLSVLVLALYIDSPEIESLYHRPKVIWALCVLLLFWVSRVWMTAQRGSMHDDPVVYALRDRVSLAVGLLMVVTALCAI
jgi:4-hydroxybenzoate polyprenyltransferase